VAVVLTPVQTKQIRINIHKRNNTRTQYKTQYKQHKTQYKQYKYTCYQNTPTLQSPHIHTPTHYKTHTYTHPHIRKPTHTHTHTLQYPHTHTPTHYKTTTVQDTHQMMYNTCSVLPQMYKFTHRSLMLLNLTN